MKTTNTDRIERHVFLKVPRSRVWKALSDAEEFGAWFGVKLKGKRFTAGQRVQGQVDHPDYQHMLWDVLIERIEPMHLLSWRWHPAACEKGVDYSHEPTTLVVFELADAPGGTLLKVTESGFDALPEGRRIDAFRLNGDGWDEQMRRVERHVTAH